MRNVSKGAYLTAPVIHRRDVLLSVSWKISDFSRLALVHNKGTIVSEWLARARAHAKQRSKKEKGMRQEAAGKGEQTGSNLIIRNAPELGNEGLSFHRLTPSGRRCYSFVCPERTRGTFLPLVQLCRASPLFFRYFRGSSCRLEKLMSMIRRVERTARRPAKL